MNPLRISFQNYHSVKNLDPAKIETLYEANLIENLYSRIVDYDNNGMLICVLCESFTVEKNIISIQFKSNLKTNNGSELTAKDAVKSLRRLLQSNTNTHGNLELFIESEDYITEKNNVLMIEMKNPHFSQFLLPLLASMDFSIIPSIAIDENNKIVDHGITSGPYYVSKDDELGYLFLSANKNHIEYSMDMYQEIKIIPSEKGDVIDDYLQKKIDVIDITNYPRTITYDKFLSNEGKHLVKLKTIPMNLMLLNTSKNALKKFTKEQLFYAFKIIAQKQLEFKTYGYGFTENIEFFPNNGNGRLSDVQSTFIKDLRTNKEIPKLDTQIVFGVYKNSYEMVKEAFKNIKEIKIVSYDKTPSFLPQDKRPDIFIQTTDASFNEDISLLSYNFSMEYFGKTKSEGEKWLKEYIEIEDKSERIKRLQDLHFEILKSGVIYPIGISPYWAIANEDIELNFPTFFPGSHWWKIRKK